MSLCNKGGGQGLLVYKDLPLGMGSEITVILLLQLMFLLKDYMDFLNHGERAATVIGCDVNKPFKSYLYDKIV